MYGPEDVYTSIPDYGCIVIYIDLLFSSLEVGKENIFKWMNLQISSMGNDALLACQYWDVYKGVQLIILRSQYSKHKDLQRGRKHSIISSLIIIWIVNANSTINLYIRRH